LHFKGYFEAALSRAIALGHSQQAKATAESSGQAGMWMLNFSRLVHKVACRHQHRLRAVKE